MVSFEGECAGVREGRPMEKEKGREKEEKENMKATDDSEVMDSMEAKEHQRARGRSRTRKNKTRDKSSNGTCDNWRKSGEHKRKKQRKCGMSLERSSVLRSGALADDEQER